MWLIGYICTWLVYQRMQQDWFSILGQNIQLKQGLIRYIAKSKDRKLKLIFVESVTALDIKTKFLPFVNFVKNEFSSGGRGSKKDPPCPFEVLDSLGISWPPTAMLKLYIRLLHKPYVNGVNLIPVFKMLPFSCVDYMLTMKCGTFLLYKAFQK